jgi:hypothetical protein
MKRSIEEINAEIVEYKEWIARREARKDPDIAYTACLQGKLDSLEAFLETMDKRKVEES